jgi:hypothetical protein
MRIVWTVLFGAMVTLVFGAVVVHERGARGLLRTGRAATGRVKRLMTVEEAVRLRLE